MEENIYISIIQANIIWQDIDGNIKSFDCKIDQISDKTDIIVLPEMFNTGFSLEPERNFDVMEGKTIRWMLKKAAQKDAIICGTIIISEKNNFYNRFLFAFPNGNVLFYDKRHLFRMAKEHYHYTSGNNRLIIEYKGWKIRPLVCYDLRFPVWSRNVNDYDILIYTANWPESRRFQWRTLLTARAIENQSYTVGVNRIGTDGNKVEYSGDSVILGPVGETIANTELYKDEIKTVELNYEKLKNYRNNFPARLDADKFEIL